MNIKLNEVAHFYLGCFCTDQSGKLYQLQPSHFPSNWMLTDFSHKLNLWHIGSLPNKVLIEVAEYCYESVYGDKPAMDNIQFFHGGEDGSGMRFTDNDFDAYGLTVSIEGVLFSVNGSYLKIPVLNIITLLAKNSVDMFGLIDAGLANKIKEKNLEGEIKQQRKLIGETDVVNGLKEKGII